MGFFYIKNILFTLNDTITYKIKKVQKEFKNSRKKYLDKINS